MATCVSSEVIEYRMAQEAVHARDIRSADLQEELTKLREQL
jgi:hypothetical protein